MRKNVIFFIAIVLLCLIGRGLFLYYKPRVGIGNAKPDISMQAADLYHQYNANEEAANKKFLNKVIAVTGVVDDVSRQHSACVILLKNKNETGGVSCHLFANTNAHIQQGETLTIKGRCTGFLMDAALTDCIIEQP